MKRIYLGFSTSKKCKPFSALIKWWWKTPYSHVYLRWPTPWGFDEVLEASGSHVRMIEHTTWQKKNKVIKEIAYDIPREQWNEVMINLRGKTGTPYGHLQLLTLAVCELLGLEENPWGDGDASWICSELAVKFLSIISKLPPDVYWDRVTPYDIWEIVHR